MIPSFNPKTIHVLCVGERHDDPAASHCILAALNILTKRKLPIVFCAEKPADQNDVTKQYDQYMLEIDSLGGFVKEYNLSDFSSFSKQLEFPHFGKIDQIRLHEKIRAIVKENDTIKPDQHDDFAKFLLDSITQLNAKCKKRDVLRFTIEHNLHYASIDINKDERDPFIKELESATKPVAVVIQYENKRIEQMVSVIFKNAISVLLSTGGVILCNVGVLHAHRLAATIHHAFHTSLFPLPQNIHISATAMFCHSSNSKDADANSVNDHVDQQIKDACDSEEIKSMYNHVPFAQIYLRSSELSSEVPPDRFNEIIESVADSLRQEAFENCKS